MNWLIVWHKYLINNTVINNMMMIPILDCNSFSANITHVQASRKHKHKSHTAYFHYPAEGSYICCNYFLIALTKPSIIYSANEQWVNSPQGPLSMGPVIISIVKTSK